MLCRALCSQDKPPDYNFLLEDKMPGSPTTLQFEGANVTTSLLYVFCFQCVTCQVLTSITGACSWLFFITSGF